MVSKTSTTCTCSHKLGIIALVLSVAALVLAGFSTYKSISLNLDDEAFSAQVEKGITAFINKQQKAQAGAEEPTGPVDVSIDDDPIKGNKNAPVTIVEFSDFECPYCSRFAQEALSQIKAEYVDKGKARFVFRDFPLGFHPNARPAALAANCARDQGGDEMYYKFHDKIYANQSVLSVDNLKKWAVELGLNASKFNSCLDSKKYDAEIENDIKQGTAYGVKGTPATFINGRLISGAQPFANFKAIIDEELQKVGK